MNDLIPQSNEAQTNFSRAVTAPGGNVGAIAIESERAIAEAQGQLILAKRFPRDLNAAYAELMDACKMPAMANVAFYALPRGGKTISGPSVRLAEEIARVYGNFEYGHRELSRTAGKSEIEVYAWDKQTNNRSIRQITVMHTIDTKDGQRPLRDQKEIDDKIANVASKQIRGRILAMMPKWMVEAAINECRATLAGSNSEPIGVRVRRMTQAFATFGVNVDHLERRLGHKLDDVTLDELVDLTGIYNAIKEGERASDFFSSEAPTDDAAPSAAAKAITAAAASTAAKKTTTTTKPATATKTVIKSTEKEAGNGDKESNPVKDTAPAVSEKAVQAESQQRESAATEEEDSANAAPEADGEEIF